MIVLLLISMILCFCVDMVVMLCIRFISWGWCRWLVFVVRILVLSLRIMCMVDMLVGYWF